jgi:hypothetical protein
MVHLAADNYRAARGEIVSDESFAIGALDALHRFDERLKCDHVAEFLEEEL